MKGIRSLKSIACIAFSAALSLLITACSGAGDQPDESSSAVATTVGTTTAASTTTPTTAAPTTTTATTATTTAVPTTVKIPPVETPPISYVVPASDAVSDSYFDDAVFIGDSVSLKLKLYALAQRQSSAGFLGKAQFLTSGSLGSGNALWAVSNQSVHPSYNGTKMLLEDAVAACGAKKAYIMLGMNDIGLYGVDKAIQNLDTLLGRIREKTPDVRFYLQSVTPMVTSRQLSDLNNESIGRYNAALSAYCEAKGYYFLNVASVMRDDDGGLIPAYCSDSSGMGIHFTDAGCKTWVDYLRTHTA